MKHQMSESDTESERLMSHNDSIYDPKRKNTSPKKKHNLIIAMALCMGVAICFVCLSRADISPFTVSPTSSSSLGRGRSKRSSLPQIMCPRYDNIEPSLNDGTGGTITKFYENDLENKKIDLTAASLTLEQIEDMKQSIDGWARGYNALKDSKKPWIKTMFGSSIKNGDTIFESGCGRGFNLLWTLEILKEELNIQNLNVYGIEYVQSSVEVANKVLGTALPPLGSKLGSQICRGDATDLYFIPDESFDLVYTGYIEPIPDSLGIEEHLGRDLEFEDICNITNPEEDWAKVKLGQLGQERQEEWYSSWVKELIRVAKKGKPVIVEEVSLPLCDDWSDWGGVSQEWWHEAAAKYNWDVDVNSIHVEKQSNGEGNRYDVFMRKNE